MAGRDLLAVIFLSSAVVVTLLSSSKGTVHFQDCQDGVMTFRETLNINLYCYDLYGPAGVITWTLKSDNGSTIALGTCSTPNDCTAYNGNLRVYWKYRLGSRFYIRNISKDFSGTVHCNIIRNDMVDKASCRINVVHTTGPQKPSSDKNSDNLKWAGIGVATTLGIVVVVILVVVLVVWTCRRGHPDSTKPEGRQEPYNSDTDTHLYEGLHTNSNRGRRLPSEPNQDNVYENAAVEEREAHM